MTFRMEKQNWWSGRYGVSDDAASCRQLVYLTSYPNRHWVPVRLIMPADLPIRCSCGCLRGVANNVSAARGNRLVCYCDDCQSFAHYLERADQILDAHGGTDIFQMSPARLEISAGIDHLACIRLTPKGPLRWYADCCKTPIGNTLATRHLPFLGLILFCIDHAADNTSLDATLGPVRGRVFARFSKGKPINLDAHDRVSASVLGRIATLILVARLHGEHKKSPFFDPRTDKPSALPRILSEAELRTVENARDAR